MPHTTTLFSQMLSQIPRHVFQKIEARHKTGRASRKFGFKEQFTVMAFIQLAARRSMRDGLRACAMAASGARYRPPSEKLSEVMLTMPKMMSDLFMGASIIIIIEHESHTDARVERESPGE